MNSSAFPPLPRVPFPFIVAPPHPTNPRIALTIGDRNRGDDRETAASSPKTSSIAPNPSIPIFTMAARPLTLKPSMLAAAVAVVDRKSPSVNGELSSAAWQTLLRTS